MPKLAPRFPLPYSLHRRHTARVKKITGCARRVRFHPAREGFPQHHADVRDFGAIGDGQTDDTAAVQSAVDALLDQGGGLLRFSPGRYLIDSVKVGPGLTLWGYGATLVKPGLRHYIGRHLEAHEALTEEERAALVEPIRTLAYHLPGGDTARVRAILALLAADEPDEEEPTEEDLAFLEAVRTQTQDLLDLDDLSDDALDGWMEHVIGSRSAAKWSRTFRTYSHLSTPDQYLYHGEGDSAPLVIKGFAFEGQRAEMGIYTNYEIEQQHMILLTAHANSPGRLRAYVRDCCFRDGVGDSVSVYVNVRVYLRNLVAHDVFRGAVTVTGGNSVIDVADLRAGGDDHPTGIDWEIDGGSWVRNGKPMPSPQFHTVTRARRLILDGDFDVGLSGGSFHGEDITVHAPPFNLGGNGCGHIHIRDSSFGVGRVLSSHREDPIQVGRYVSDIKQPHDVHFENVTFHAVAPTLEETGEPLAFFSMLRLIQVTNYVSPRLGVLRFTRCTFKLGGNLPDEVETRILSTNNDVLLHHNGTLFEDCWMGGTGLDYGLHIGGGNGALGNWGTVGGGAFRFIDTTVDARIGAFVGFSEAFQTYADLRGLQGGPAHEALFETANDLSEEDIRENAFITVLLP